MMRYMEHLPIEYIIKKNKANTNSDHISPDLESFSAA